MSVIYSLRAIRDLDEIAACPARHPHELPLIWIKAPSDKPSMNSTKAGRLFLPPSNLIRQSVPAFPSAGTFAWLAQPIVATLMCLKVRPMHRAYQNPLADGDRK
jgi:hypothetical protein